MKLNGETIETKGCCLICGTRLKTGAICFDCTNPSDTEKDTLKRIIEKQMEKVKAGQKLDLEPVDGEDYYVQYEVLAYIEASGMIRGFVTEVDDRDELLDKFYESGKSLSDADMEIEISHTESTGRTRLITPDGRPFHKHEWLQNKLHRTNNGFKPSANLQQASLTSLGVEIGGN